MNRKVWDDIMEAFVKGFRNMGDGVGGQLRRQGRRTARNADDIDATDRAASALTGNPGRAPDYRATFGNTSDHNYRNTFSSANPDVDMSETVVHHAVERQVSRRYPGVVSQDELHSIENLRGIPRDVNDTVHLSAIRKEWNRFYRTHPAATQQELLDFATEIDKKFGHLFNPPV